MITTFLEIPYAIFLLPLIIWEVVWKGIALWRAARNKHLGWFVSILILNTIGILPIVYIVYFSKPKRKRK